MLFEKIVVRRHMGQLSPFFHIDGVLVQIVYFCAAHRQYEGGMGGDNQLAAEKPGAVFKELGKLLLL